VGYRAQREADLQKEAVTVKNHKSKIKYNKKKGSKGKAKRREEKKRKGKWTKQSWLCMDNIGERRLGSASSGPFDDARAIQM
jgi:hypothetical protein